MNQPTRPNLHATLTDWQERMRELEAQMDALAGLIGTSPESPLQAAVYAVMGAYTRTVGQALGAWDDVLLDWWTEHNFGERPMQIGLDGEPLRTITAIEELAALIADDAAAEQ